MKEYAHHSFKCGKNHDDRVRNFGQGRKPLPKNSQKQPRKKG